MTKDLVSVYNEQLAYSEIIPTMHSQSTFDEVSEGTFEYKRKEGIGFDELEIQIMGGGVVTYILDTRSSLTYKTLPGPTVRLRGYVYDRQPRRRDNS